MKNSNMKLSIGITVFISVILISCSDSNNNITSIEHEPIIRDSMVSATIPTCETRKYDETHYTGSGSSSYEDFNNPIVCTPSGGGDGYLVITTFGEILNRSYYVEVLKWDDLDNDWELYTSYFLDGGNSYFINTSVGYINLDGSDRFKVNVLEPLPPGTGGGGGGSSEDIFRTKFDLND
ncbi:MAG: hypothetical protein ACMZ7B_04180 [Balneola sp.]